LPATIPCHAEIAQQEQFHINSRRPSHHLLLPPKEISESQEPMGSPALSAFGPIHPFASSFFFVSFLPLLLPLLVAMHLGPDHAKAWLFTEREAQTGRFRALEYSFCPTEWPLYWQLYPVGNQSILAANSARSRKYLDCFSPSWCFHRGSKMENPT
jgi:hypothetical protein